MADLIDRQAAIKALEEYNSNMLRHFEICCGIEKHRVNDCIELLRQLEPAKERTGHWIDTSPTYHHGASRNAHVCSNCHDYFTTSPEEMNYCPNCGTHMITED